MVISFCGHGDIFYSDEILNKIMFYLNKIIKKNGNVNFYLGGYGNFDELARIACTQYKKNNPNSKLIYVTPYVNIPSSKIEFFKKNYDEILYPSLEYVPHKYAIIYRNYWVVEHSDIIISYVKYSWGGAYKTMSYALKLNKIVLDLFNWLIFCIAFLSYIC